MEENVNASSPSSSSAFNSHYFHDRSRLSSSDELSQFLRQILVRSSSSPSSASTALGHPPSNIVNRVISTADLSDRSTQYYVSAPGTSSACFSGNAQGSNGANASSSTVAASENETVIHEYDYESEEGVGAVVNEPSEKPAPPRSSSKRSRAAEVHNLSEKRRRSRINEKMKALQKLIPNSNKTDKASMLDEAIEYLKQLQLQVQMLSMRNGLSLNPMFSPRGIHQMQLSQTQLNRQNHLTSVSDIIREETSLGFESSSLQRHFKQFHVHSSLSEEICSRDGVLPHHQMNISHPNPNLSEFEVGGMGRVTITLETEGLLFKNLEEPNLTSSSGFSG